MLHVWEITQSNIGASENLTGYGYYDINSNTYEPFQYWYDDEEQAGGGGHYSNIRNKTQYTTGFGCNTTGKAKGMYVAVQNFYGSVYGATASERVLYTTDELRAKLKEFITLASQTGADAIVKAQQAVTDAQAAVEAAKSALATATDNVTTKQAAVTSAQNAYDAAKQSYQSDAAAKVATAQKALDSANSAKSDADAAVTAAQAALSTARSALATKNAELASAKQAKNAADATVTERQADVEAATKKLESIKGGTEVADAQKEVDSAQAALADAKKAASNADEALETAQKTAADAKAQLEDAEDKLASANAAAADAKQKALLANESRQAAESAYQDLRSRVGARDTAKSALDQAEAALKKAEADLAAARAALPGLRTQAKQYEDVANIIARLPSSDAYLEDPQVLLDAADALREHGKTEGLTDATKASIGRFCKLLNDAYALATEAKNLGPTIARDQKAADDADAALASARADFDLGNQIYRHLAMSGKYGHTSAAASKAARTPGKALVPASVSTPKHMAAQSSLPKTGDPSMPFLPFGLAGAFAALMGARQRRRED